MALFDAPTLLDGAMGTALIARGLPAGALPEEWILSRPEEIAAVHASHAAAGARVIFTCTFNASPARLGLRGIADRCEALCGWAERLARSAGRGVLVAGAVGPTGLVKPGETPAGDLAEEYAAPFRALAAAGVDLLWSESHWNLDEALLALAAARATGLPAAITLTLVVEGGAFRAPQGPSARECLLALAKAGAAAVGVNCVPADEALAVLAGELAPALPVPLVVKPSAGLPGAILAPPAFATAVAAALAAGARLAGGCCGTGPEHLQALASHLV
jgi:5-methyltetrahydrofolate--homocysteine methyltransferase